MSNSSNSPSTDNNADPLRSTRAPCTIIRSPFGPNHGELLRRKPVANRLSRPPFRDRKHLVNVLSHQQTMKQGKRETLHQLLPIIRVKRNLKTGRRISLCGRSLYSSLLSVSRYFLSMNMAGVVHSTLPTKAYDHVGTPSELPVRHTYAL
ncbi:hypothetical protein CPB84DRAFT_1345841 [Gymnopilus junonius]|uniref:Uncharacterized protein n=1 Tax=Gymnopilus junonius TaxID=109634 RepID=A0A9P5NXA6_GYMJU|nr:hypothetical protein CPB84DRAFT_1345841 [Gymnopilus junonius]